MYLSICASFHRRWANDMGIQISLHMGHIFNPLDTVGRKGHIQTHKIVGI